MLSWAAIGAAQDKIAHVAELPVFAPPFGLLSVVLPAVELPVVLPAITLTTPGLPRFTTQPN